MRLGIRYLNNWRIVMRIRILFSFCFLKSGAINAIYEKKSHPQHLASILPDKEPFCHCLGFLDSFTSTDQYSNRETSVNRSLLRVYGWKRNSLKNKTILDAPTVLNVRSIRTRVSWMLLVLCWCMYPTLHSTSWYQHTLKVNTHKS